MSIRQTHTYATLEVSRAAYDEIAEKLRAAEYHHSFATSPVRELIDMHGIALVPEQIIRCEHGVSDGDWCEPCAKEFKRARNAPENNP